MEKITLVVAAHKKCRMPEDSLYLPLQVGKYKKEALGYETDDTGNNISSKNNVYCELTGLYWAWKNLQADYIGLVHYRRFFAKKKFLRQPKNLDASLISKQDIQQALSQDKIIVPKKRKYYIETIYSHYAHTHYAEHLDKSLEIIRRSYPEYEQAFEQVMNARSAYMFNMFVMSRQNLTAYCQWLFDILFSLEKIIDTKSYSDFQKRYIGRVSEILFNVWLQKNNIQVKEIPFVYIGKINYWNKGISFLKAKFQKKKFENSF